jgi:hypothetical protein
LVDQYCYVYKKQNEIYYGYPILEYLPYDISENALINSEFANDASDWTNNFIADSVIGEETANIIAKSVSPIMDVIQYDSEDSDEKLRKLNIKFKANLPYAKGAIINNGFSEVAK